MRGLGWFTLAAGFGAILIPWPHLLPLSLIAWAVIYLVTPTYGHERYPSARKGKGSS